MAQQHPTIELAARLVGINSENPGCQEAEIVSFIAGWLDRAGLAYRLQEVAPGRQNVIARVPGQGRRGPLVLVAHCDTVPAGEGWSLEPFAPTVRGGRLHGRGASDMKGGLAASLYALQEVQKAGPPPGDLVVAVTVDEESSQMLGVTGLVQSCEVGADTMVIAPEPTNLEIIRSHKGVLWLEIITHGVMSHAGNANRGVDANHALAEVICELKAASNAVPFVDPLVGGVFLTASVMAGGVKTNVVPNRARAEVDLRVGLPFTVETATRLVERAAGRAIRRVEGASVEVKPLGLQRPPVETPEDAPVIRLLADAARRVMGKTPALGGYPAYTDAAVVSWYLGNRNCILFGPGSLLQGHTVDEWVPTDEIATCAEVLKEAALS